MTAGAPYVATPSRTTPELNVDQLAKADFHTQLEVVRRHIRSYSLPSMVPLLKLFFRVRGKPFTLDRHYIFEPLYRRRMPKILTVTSGRQVAKSTNFAARTTLQTVSMPYFDTLVVCPLFEMTRRISTNYFGPLISDSPLNRLITSGDKARQSVLQRTFYNGATIHFNFAFLSPDRARGISVSQVNWDEWQDMNPDFVPVISETASASDYDVSLRTGTPKSTENNQWVDHTRSSMAEWIIPCGACNYWNIPSVEYDLLKMIGPVHDDIGPGCPATICADCRRPIDPVYGHWEHRYPDKRWDHEGLHIPQLLLPHHYEDKDRWSKIVAKSEGSIPINQFYNEVLGEACDTGTKLVSVEDLRKAAILAPNNLDRRRDPDSQYVCKILGIDWGGGGESGVSFTVFVVAGIRPDGKIDVIYAKKSLTPNDHIGEAMMALDLVNQFRCQFVAHDYSGAGAVRETILVQSGFPLRSIYPIAYQGATVGEILKHVPPTKGHPRDYWVADKSRTLVSTCTGIKLGCVRFFAYDHHGSENPGLLHDFLALMEEKTDSRSGTDIYRVTRNKLKSDDFAQAVNIACAVLWQKTRWPDFAEQLVKYRVTANLIRSLVDPDYLD